MKARLLALFVFAGLLAMMPAATVLAQGQPQRIEITAKRFNFTPNEITVKVGQPVIIVLKSADVAHGLRIRDLGVDMKVKAGQTSQVEFTPGKVGDFTGHCSVFCGSGHGSMTFTLHVVS